MTARSLATDLRALGRRGMRAVQAAPAWLGGILTGVQGLALSYLAVLAPTLAVAASTPQGGVGGTDWSGATAAATNVWMLGHGVPAQVSGAEVGLIPLGLTLLYGAILAAVARRFAARTRGSWVIAVATYAAGVGAVASFGERPGEASRIAIATAVAVAVAAVGVGIGIWRAYGIDMAWRERIPVWVRAGLRRGAATASAAVMVAAAATAVWAVANRHAIGDTATGLDLDLVSAGVLAISALAYAPTITIWMTAWLAGPGFSVGSGTLYAPGEIAVDALPALPVLGALPSAAGGLLVWVPVLIVVTALGVRLVVRRPDLSWRHDLAADAVAAGAIAVGMAVVFAVTTGDAGPGRLETVGPDVVVATAAVTGLAAAGLLLGVFALRVPPAASSAWQERRTEPVNAA